MTFREANRTRYSSNLKMTINLGVASRSYEYHTGGFESSKASPVVWSDLDPEKSDAVDRCTVTATADCRDRDLFCGSSRNEDKLYELSGWLSLVDR